MPEIKLKYEKNRDYRIIPISGAFGSINPQGMVVCDLYLERLPAPPEITLSIDEEAGTMTETKIEKYSQPIIRELSFGMVMTPEVAKALGEWLLKKHEEYIKISEQRQ